MRRLLIGIALFFSVTTGCQSDNTGEVVNEHGDIQNLEALNTFVERVENNTEAEINYVAYGVEGQRGVNRLMFNGEQINVSHSVDGEFVEEYNCQDIKTETEEETKHYILSQCAGDFKGEKDFPMLSIPSVESSQTESEEEMVQLNDYTFEDYKLIFEEAEEETKNFKTEDELLNKWIFRTLAQEKLSKETDLTEDQVLQLARKSMKENNMWKTYAEEEYDIHITDEELDAYISEGPDTSEEPQHLAIAEALGMNLTEYNHHFDRDLYEKNLIWEKLKPILEEKYGTNDNNQLVKKYQEEVAQNTKG